MPGYAPGERGLSLFCIVPLGNIQDNCLSGMPYDGITAVSCLLNATGKLKQSLWSCYQNLRGTLKGWLLDTLTGVHIQGLVCIIGTCRREMAKPWKDRL